jgi:hypothetical protein
MLIKGNIPHYYTAPEITNDTRGLYVNVETLELSYYVKTRMENNPLWCNITDIFKRQLRAKDIVRALEKQGEEVSRERDDIIDDNMRAIENIVEREFPEQTIPVKASIREAIDIFYKVNAGGVALTDAELALAQISGYWPQAREQFKAKLVKLGEDGFVFKLDFIVYVLLGCLYHMGSDMRKLHGEGNKESIKNAWEQLDSHTLDYVANLMRTHAYVDHTYEINSVYALVPIIVYCFNRGKNHLDDKEIRKAIKWFYYSQIRARYISQLPQKLDFDLRIIAESENPFDELLAVIAEERRLEILPDEFVGRSISHPLFGLMRWYMKSRGAICFTTGVGIRQNMGEKYQLEKDHIFPYSSLKSAGYGKGNRLKYALAQEMTNRALLTQVANRRKSGMTAKAYLTDVKKRHKSALALQCIPEDETLWELERYEDFLAERRRMLAEQLNQFLDNITTFSEDIGEPISLLEVIAEGESDELEFKSSLRWDFNQGVINKKLEDVIVKTISAFANADGGTLLIGVDDDGNILGLENDYASLKADRDKFELHARNIFNKQFGTAFVTSKLSMSFPTVVETEICQIDIEPASEPIVVKLKDAHNNLVERFYVRSGNSSQEIPLSQMKAYFKDRFS